MNEQIPQQISGEPLEAKEAQSYNPARIRARVRALAFFMCLALLGALAFTTEDKIQAGLVAAVIQLVGMISAFYFKKEE